MTQNEKAIEQLKSLDINAYEENDTVYVLIGEVALELSDFEIEFRAKLYDRE